MLLVLGMFFIVFGMVLVGVTMGKSQDWAPRLAKLIWVIGWPQASARDKVRMLAYIAIAIGTVEVIRAIWFGAGNV